MQKRHYLIAPPPRVRRRPHPVPQLILLCLLCLAATARAQGDVAEQEAALAALRARIASIQTQVESAQSERSAAAGALRDVEARLAAAGRRLRKVSGERDAQAQKLARTEARHALAVRRLDEESAALARQLRAAFMMGRRSGTRLLLQQDEPRRINRVMGYYDYLNRSRQQRMGELSARIGELRQLLAAVLQEREQLDQLSAKLQEELRAHEEQRTQRSQLLEKLDRDIASQARALEGLRADETELNGLIERLRKALADIPLQLESLPPFRERRRQLPWPLEGRLLARFGEAKAGGQSRWHGIWIAAEPGTGVRAIAPGRVAYVGWMMRYGLIAVVEHGDGFYSLYGHNQAVWKETGEWVTGGELLAAAGDSGGQRRAGLYLEIRSLRGPQDPLLWLRNP